MKSTMGFFSFSDHKTCDANFYACKSADDKNITKCLNPLEVCDGVNDCPNGEDERGCGMRLKNFLWHFILIWTIEILFFLKIFFQPPKFADQGNSNAIPADAFPAFGNATDSKNFWEILRKFLEIHWEFLVNWIVDFVVS